MSENCILWDPRGESFRNSKKIRPSEGVPLTPHQCRQGLLPTMNAGGKTFLLHRVCKFFIICFFKVLTRKYIRYMDHDVSIIDDSCSDSSDSDTTYNIDCRNKKNKTKNSEINFSSDSSESKKADSLTTKNLKKK